MNKSAGTGDPSRPWPAIVGLGACGEVPIAPVTVWARTARSPSRCRPSTRFRKPTSERLQTSLAEKAHPNVKIEETAAASSDDARVQPQHRNFHRFQRL